MFAYLLRLRLFQFGPGDFGPGGPGGKVLFVGVRREVVGASGPQIPVTGFTVGTGPRAPVVGRLGEGTSNVLTFPSRCLLARPGVEGSLNVRLLAGNCVPVRVEKNLPDLSFTNAKPTAFQRHR